LLRSPGSSTNIALVDRQQILELRVQLCDPGFDLGAQFLQIAFAARSPAAQEARSMGTDFGADHGLPHA